MSATLRLRGDHETVWVPKRRSCDCGGSCGKCTANGGMGVMEQVRVFREPTWHQGSGARARRAGMVAPSSASSPPARGRSSYPLRPPVELPDVDLCDGTPPYIQMPNFDSVHFATKVCFSIEYGSLEWPDVTCCRVPVNETDDCEVPSFGEWSGWLSRTVVLNSTSARAMDAASLRATSWDDPSSADLDLYFSALALLHRNLDIGLWAACKVEGWSPEIEGLGLADNLALLFDSGNGSPELGVGFVDLSERSAGATAWAVVRGDDLALGVPVSVVVPIGHPLWSSLQTQYTRGGEGALCALTRVAQIILHEMVHIVGDRYGTGANEPGKWTGYGAASEWARLRRGKQFGFAGTLHDDGAVESTAADPWAVYTCWDECRMVASMFVWGMHQRYRCLASASGCDYMADPEVFANSIAGGG